VRLRGADHIENNFASIVVTFSREVFTGGRLGTAILLFLPVFIAVKMFTGIPVLL
jgi:hypothetical protein